MNQKRRLCAGKPDGSPCSAPAMKDSAHCRHHQPIPLIDQAAAEEKRFREAWIAAQQAGGLSPTGDLQTASVAAFKRWQAARRRLKAAAKVRFNEELSRSGRANRPDPRGRPYTGLFSGRDWETVPLLNQFVQAVAPEDLDPVSVNVSELAVWFLRRVAEAPPGEPTGEIIWTDETTWLQHVAFLARIQALAKAVMAAAADGTPVPAAVLAQLNDVYQQHIRLSIALNHDTRAEVPLKELSLSETTSEEIPALGATLLLDLWRVLSHPYDVARCTICENPFLTTRPRQQFCSSRCSNRLWERENRSAKGRKSGEDWREGEGVNATELTAGNPINGLAYSVSMR